MGGAQRCDGDEEQTDRAPRRSHRGALRRIHRLHTLRVQLLGHRKHRRLHQIRCFRQIGGTDRVAGAIVCACGLDQPRVRGQHSCDRRDVRGAEFVLFGQAGSRDDEFPGCLGNSLEIAVAHLGGLDTSRDEAGDGSRIGDGQRAVQILGGVRERFGGCEETIVGGLPATRDLGRHHTRDHQQDSEHQPERDQLRRCRVEEFPQSVDAVALPLGLLHRPGRESDRIDRRGHAYVHVATPS